MLILYIISCFEGVNLIPLCVNIGLVCTQFGSLKFQTNTIFQIYETIILFIQIALITLYHQQMIVYNVIYLILQDETTIFKQAILQKVSLLGTSVFIVVFISTNVIEYVRNSAFALGILIVLINKQKIPKKEEFNNLFSCTRTQSPRQIDSLGLMIVDSINLNCIYMNDYVKRKLGNQQLKINKIDSSSKQKLDYKVRNIELFELLNDFNLKQLSTMQILDSNIMSDHIIQITKDENDNKINITFQNSKERDEYLKKSYLYKIMKQIFNTISHEFGTQLNFILAISQVAIDKYPTQQYYQSIRNTCQIMHNFILDMIDYNDILGNQFKLQLEELDIQTILEQVTILFQDQCRQKDLSLDFENHIPDCWQIISDQRRIKQILIHLISNAQKFTLTGSIKIKVLGIKDDLIQFSVTDTGIGINQTEEQNLRQMLEQDFKDEQQLSSNTAGFGLGCYLANKICLHLSNKQFKLEFRRNEVGTTFWFLVQNHILPTQSISKLLGIQQINKHSYIDLKQSQIERTVGKKLSKVASKISLNSKSRILSFRCLIDPVKENTESIINEEVNSIERKARTCTLNRNVKKQMRFLIVDDEIINIIGLQLILKRMNIEIDYVFNGVECLKIVEQKRYVYQGIFMDINMPLMDGYEATRQLISRYGNQIKIIACTAYTDSETKQRCYDIGMSYFLNKPVNIVELQKILIQFQQ